MDAGGLAQMSYNNNFPSSNGLGMPGSGFASRRANAPIKHLNFELPKQSDSHDNGAPTPRTSRSHLLAGLRTAPKSATSSTFPSTAPPTQLQHNIGLAGSIYADKESYGGPKTSLYSNQQGGYSQMNNRQMYSVPEQPLAPPEIFVDEHGQEQMDPNLYAQLVATNMYLAEQQQRLQQQLINVQAAAQQFQGLSLGMGSQMQQQFATPPVTPQNIYQQQQVKSNMQPIITPVMGTQPGIYSYYNPVTGQQNYFMDQSAQQTQFMDQQAAQQSINCSPPQQHGTPRFQVSPPPQSDNPTFTRSISPPKKSQSPPSDHAPLPPPSAGAFRRGHRKANSMAIGTDMPAQFDGPKSALLPKSMGFPSTPTASGFGPGQARAGEHPIRQPRGPPPLDELIAKPTTKFEGSKNFATRTRRSAVHNLVRAGNERRRAPGSAGSGSMSPVSEVGEVTFSVSSDNDSDSGRSGSGSLSGRPSLGSSRASAHGAIGSDRPSSRQKERSSERKSVASVDSNFTTASVSDEDSSVGGSFAAVFKNGGKKPEPNNVERKAPMLVLTSAEKRKVGPLY
jgi:hypothetical protein